MEYAALYTKLFADLVNPLASKRKVLGFPFYDTVVPFMATVYIRISLETVVVVAEKSHKQLLCVLLVKISVLCDMPFLDLLDNVL